MFVLGTLLCGASLYAQEKTVSGTVKDTNGFPVADAVVKTSSGKEVYTDENGAFSIESNKGEVLIVESLGSPTQTILVGDETNYTISLKDSDDIELDEAVVTALGIKRDKKSLGFASQEIKAEELTSGTTVTGNVASLLSGKVAGLNVTTTSNFGGSSNLVIRGVKAVAGSSPLIVIDGSPVNNSVTRAGNVDYGNALSDINQEDIASINVLKGAAASALYGERGLNGVIVITTKNGRGKDDKSWGVTLTTSTQVGSIDKSTFPEYQTKYGSGYASKFDIDGYVNYKDDGSWGPAFDPNVMVYKWDAFDPSSPNFGKQTPWLAAENGPITFFNTPVTYTNSISLSKGDATNNFNFGYTNMYSDGLMPNSNLNRNLFSVKVNHDLNERLHATVYSTLTLQSTRNRNQTNYSNNTMSTFRQWWSVDVDLQDQKRAYFANRGRGLDYNYGNVTWNRVSAANGRPIYMNNPYFQEYENYGSDDRVRSFSYAQLTFDASKNINLTAKVSHDLSDMLIERRLAVGSLNQSFGLSGTNVGSGYHRTDITRSETNFDVLANYKFDVSADINVSGVVGANVRRNKYSSISASTEGGLIVPGVYALSNSYGSVLPPQESLWTTQTNSAFATTSIDFYKIFYLDATWRIDNSSTLPSENNTYNYPSVTGALILSEFIDASWMNFWKVRANYAEVGGTADPYLTKNYFAPVGKFEGLGGLPIYNTLTAQANADLKPQRAKEFEVGTELSLFNNRFTLDFAYYKTKTIDQIISLPVSPGSGYLTTNINAGRIDNWGYEVQLGIVPARSKDFTWNIDVNWGLNRNKVIELNEGVSNYLLSSIQGGVSLNARVGEAWGTLVGSDYTYLNGQKVVDPVSGHYVRNNNQIIGNATPDWIGGVRNSFKIKDFHVSFLVDVRHGGDVFSTDMWYGLGTGVYKETAEGNIREVGIVNPGVNPDGSPNTTVTANFRNAGQMFGYGQSPNAAVVYDGSYIKLREASIGYSLPEKVLRNAFIKDAKISLVGRNLWIIHKNLPYADPESMLGGGLNSYGFSIGSLPTVREIGLNVTFKF